MTPATGRQRNLLVISQVYRPDPASVGQHLADAGSAMVRRGWRVVVLTSSRGYDDPKLSYPLRETVDGVEVHRFPLSSLGKSSIAVRLVAQSVFLAQAVIRGLFVRSVDAILVSTSPPMASAAALLLRVLKGAPILYWIMDVNPDQMVETGHVRPGALSVRAFEFLNRLILRRAKAIVVLDRFMALRVNRKLDVSGKSIVIPPWPHEEHLVASPDARKHFREGAGIENEFVVMYSGNHSPSNPLETLLEAARVLESDPRFLFMFVGGGKEKRKVDGRIALGARNIRSLPYQPLERLGASLSSADLHVVSIGDAVVGVVHPCKIYGAMTVGKPVITFGPRHCHLADLVDRYKCGIHVAHGDVEGAVAAIRALFEILPEDREEMGRRGRVAVETTLSQKTLTEQFCQTLEAIPLSARTS